MCFYSDITFKKIFPEVLFTWVTKWETVQTNCEKHMESEALKSLVEDLNFSKIFIIVDETSISFMFLLESY